MGHQITFLPMKKTVEVRPGTSVLQAARQARLHIATRCGGNASCLMCKVHVGSSTDALGLSKPNAAEMRKLGHVMLQEGVRLGCQACIQGNVDITLPEDPLKAAIRKQLEQKREEEDLW